MGAAGGVDGCRGGWFSVFLFSSGEWKVGVYPDLNALWHEWKSAAQRILVDIPIGFPDSGLMERSCDLLARKILGAQKKSSVFRVPCRKALYSDDYQTANSINRRLTGKGISKQTFHIVPKMRDADKLLRSTPEARSVFRESHPEICFASFAKKHMEYAKKCSSGLEERLALLKELLPHAEDIFRYSVADFRRKDVARDDILDAMVMAASAVKRNKLSSLPRNSEYDSCGLKMEIVFPRG
ncbi:MAG: DUF429 domain-containing protein [Chitinispirillaceae bacterium]